VEVEMIKLAHEMGLLTTPYAFTADEGRRMAEAGADIVVAHMGLTTGGSIGAGSKYPGKTLDDCVKLIQEIRDEAAAVKPDVIVLCHGGPIATPGDAEYVLRRTIGVHGFYGASSMERLPVEDAITSITARFKGIAWDQQK
jgi:predicted TIM-barrel enzyme